MAKPISISSKYAWHPPHRPPPADPSIAMRVALMSPLGICLETALDELLAEDQHEHDIIGIGVGHNHGRRDGSGSSHHTTLEINGHDDSNGYVSTDNNGQLHQDNENDSESTTPTRRDHHVTFDAAMKKSILESYCKAVVETKLDDESNPSSAGATKTSSSHITAPAAMLMGEIDHYNRVGGQWRIVVKNACLKRRSTTHIDNGKTGRSLRKRMVLDWNDDHGDDNDNDAHCTVIDTGGAPDTKVRGNSSNIHRFPGTIQILAYDDDT